MASAAWLTDWEVRRIHELAAAGLKASQIAKRLGRNYHAVRREMTGLRSCERRRSGQPSKRALAQILLAHESAQRSRQLTIREDAVSPDLVRANFIDALIPAHFRKPRVAGDQFLADLARDLCDERFAPAVLRRAAAILRKEHRGTSFPKVAVVIAACRRAADEISEAAVVDAAPCEREAA